VGRSDHECLPYLKVLIIILLTLTIKMKPNYIKNTPRFNKKGDEDASQN
jgi:hypothetical protein